MSMTSKQISLEIINACKASVELNDYILTKFGKQLSYARGLNMDIDYYSDSEYADVPIIIIDPEKNVEDSDAGNLFSIVLHVKIVHKDEFKKGSFPKVDGVITLTGIDEIEEILEFVKTALKSHFASIVDIDDMDSYIDPLYHVSNYTEYNGHIVLTFFEEICIGG